MHNCPIALLTLGICNMAAISGPTCAVLLSIDSCPHKIRSNGPIFSIAFTKV